MTLSKFSLTEVELHRLRVAYTEAQAVLHSVKLHRLTGTALESMVELEDICTGLTALLIIASNSPRRKTA
jgi:hypothetical protein